MATDPPARSHDTLSIRKYIGDLIRQRRFALRLDQSDLAALTGISQAALSRYEAASTPMRAEDIPRLAEALQIDPREFFDRNIRDEMGVDWKTIEAILIENFRALMPAERVAVAQGLQRRGRSRGAPSPQWPDTASVPRYNGMGDLLDENFEPHKSEANDGSGLVSENVQREERETQ